MRPYKNDYYGVYASTIADFVWSNINGVDDVVTLTGGTAGGDDPTETVWVEWDQVDIIAVPGFVAQTIYGFVVFLEGDLSDKFMMVRAGTPWDITQVGDGFSTVPFVYKRSIW